MTVLGLDWNYTDQEPRMFQFVGPRKGFGESGKNFYINLIQTVLVRLGVKPDDSLFRELVGSLMWLSTSVRPSISNTIRSVARHS